MRALGYTVNDEEDVADIIEDYVLGYLEEDLGMGLFVNLTEGDGWDELSLRAKLSFYTEDTVDMWVLETPVSVHEFHKYLDELDLRVARKRLILELPPPEEATEPCIDEPPQPPVEILALLFGSTANEVVSELGDDWQAVRSEGMGSESKPDRYLLWDARLVVGIDDQYVHVFAPTGAPEDVDSPDVVVWFELGEHATVGLSTFASMLRSVSV